MSAERDSQAALELMDDLRSRLEDRPQISTDGLRAYIEAIEAAFGGDVDFAQVIKEYGTEAADTPLDRRYGSVAKVTSCQKKRIEGSPDMQRASTSYVERSNLTIRMGTRRFMRLTNAFSKKREMHVAMLHFFFTHLQLVPDPQDAAGYAAMEAGLSDSVRDRGWIVGLIDANTPPPARPGPRPGTRYRKRRKAV